MSWNYRVCTHLFKYSEEFPETSEMRKFPDQRIFSIQEVYYDKEGVPSGYIDDTKNPLGGWEDMSELIGTQTLIGQAFDKPVIDLDNFPNEYKQNTE